ncbi:MAG: ABC transporter substrate-binding protein [Pseudomonadota bacterium]|nr:ABC transporter substrate-binding protein [Pseudomonadota bacterium]
MKGNFTTIVQNVVRAFALYLGLTLSVAAAPVPGEAVAVVDRLHAALLEVMQNAGTLGYPGRYQKLDPLVRESFDFGTIAPIVVGRFWKELSDAQRQSFIDTFTKLSTATYAARFDGFDNEQFRHVAGEELKKGRILVKTEIVKSDGEAVRLDYVLQTKSDEWLIVNVIADGVSDLSLKRADYTSVLKTKGFDDLITDLNDKISKYGAGEE